MPEDTVLFKKELSDHFAFIQDQLCTLNLMCQCANRRTYFNNGFNKEETNEQYEARLDQLITEILKLKKEHDIKIFCFQEAPDQNDSNDRKREIAQTFYAKLQEKFPQFQVNIGDAGITGFCNVTMTDTAVYPQQQVITNQYERKLQAVARGRAQVLKLTDTLGISHVIVNVHGLFGQQTEMANDIQYCVENGLVIAGDFNISDIVDPKIAQYNQKIENDRPAIVACKNTLIKQSEKYNVDISLCLALASNKFHTYDGIIDGEALSGKSAALTLPFNHFLKQENLTGYQLNSMMQYLHMTNPSKSSSLSLSSFFPFVASLEQKILDRYVVFVKTDQINRSIQPAHHSTLLHHAVRHNSIAIVRELLKTDKKMINQPDNKDNFMPLHLAIQKGHHNMVRLLIDNSADIYAKLTVREFSRDENTTAVSKEVTPLDLALQEALIALHDVAQYTSSSSSSSSNANNNTQTNNPVVEHFNQEVAIIKLLIGNNPSTADISLLQTYYQMITDSREQDLFIGAMPKSCQQALGRQESSAQLPFSPH